MIYVEFFFFNNPYNAIWKFIYIFYNSWSLLILWITNRHKVDGDTVLQTLKQNIGV